MGETLVNGVFLVVGVLLGSFLQMRSTERQIRYTHLHERRADVLGRLHALLYETHMALERWVVPFSGYERAEQMGVVAQRYNELVSYYYPHALWLDKGTQEKLEALIKTMKDVFQDFSALPEGGAPSHVQIWNEPPKERVPELRHEVNMRVLKEMPEVRAQLQDEFQTILFPHRSWWRMFGG